MLEKILVAIDTSPQTVKVLGAAGEIASRFGSEVVVLHVQEPKLGEPVAGHQTSRESSELIGWALDELEKAGVHAKAEVRHAKPRATAREIVDAAGAFGAGAVILGSTGAHRVAGLVLGSVTRDVTQLSPCSVLVVR
jgi:nucleotide-binding universal stress UspA family protein